MKNIPRILLLSIALCMPFAAAAQQKSHNFDVAKNLDIFNALFKQLDLNYVDTINPDKLVKNAIDYMLDGLDPYTEYYSNADRGDLKQMITGKYAGIGALIHYDKQADRCIISEPYEHQPAAEAGVKAGDVILSIGGKDIDKKGSRDVSAYTSDVSSQLRGQPGTKFVLRVQRPGVPKPVSIEIVRRAIQLPSVPYFGMLADSIGYIMLQGFTEGCAADVRHALQELRDKGMKSLIFDLRGNGGGSMEEAVEIVNFFVPKGLEVVRTKGKVKAANGVSRTTRDPIEGTLPLCVLVNGGSASSSEIMSGVLQDLDRAVIIGSRTYGKGLVQQTRELPHNAILKLTTAHYYIPSGRCVQAIDYSHRNADGSVGRIPDSLTHVFHTACGRPVRDGGGIVPDVSVAHDSMPNLILYLSPQMSTSDVLFNYVTDFCLRHKAVAPPETFDLSDDEYANFCQAAVRDSLKYDRTSLRLLNELKQVAKFEGYADDAKAEFAALEAKLKHNVDYDLSLWKPQVKRLINAEIMRRYYYQAGVIRNSLNGDKDVAEAMRLLRNPDDYKSLLSPPKKK